MRLACYHLLIDALVYNEPFIWTVSNHMSDIWKVSWSEQSIERSMLFQIDCRIFRVYDCLDINLLNWAIEIRYWVRIDYLLKKFFGWKSFDDNVERAQIKKFELLLINWTLIKISLSTCLQVRFELKGSLFVIINPCHIFKIVALQNNITVVYLPLDPFQYLALFLQLTLKFFCWKIDFFM